MTSVQSTTGSATALDPDLPWCFDDEHRAWREAVREFCEREVAPTAFERNRDAIFDERLALGLGELGVYGTLIPAQRGGMDGDLRMFCIAIEELARVDSGLAASAHVQGIATALVDHLANDEQKRAVLPGAISGETFVSFGLTESSGGSDGGNFGTRARRAGTDPRSGDQAAQRRGAPEGTPARVHRTGHDHGDAAHESRPPRRDHRRARPRADSVARHPRQLSAFVLRLRRNSLGRPENLPVPADCLHRVEGR